MKPLVLAVALIALPALAASAQDVPSSPVAPAPTPPQPIKLGEMKLKDGRTLKDVTIKEVLPEGLRVSHSDGGGRILADQLPDDLRKRFQLDTPETDKAVQAFKDKQAAEVNNVAEQSIKDANARSAQKSANAEKIKPLQTKLATLRSERDKTKADIEKKREENKYGARSIPALERFVVKIEDQIKTLEAEIKSLQ
ncbi:hypothetical protein DB346_02860 [Verrucomicrobia bacterium LW23]|nr:hypothetical protein DB346_03795 [Verrucomicrobia bacterium LW23]PTY04389.1 hypothetical protein DB346_02860 [Verrucomicrobia bacterium LW23]